MNHRPIILAHDQRTREVIRAEFEAGNRAIVLRGVHFEMELSEDETSIILHGANGIVANIERRHYGRSSIVQ